MIGNFFFTFSTGISGIGTYTQGLKFFIRNAELAQEPGHQENVTPDLFVSTVFPAGLHQ